MFGGRVLTACVVVLAMVPGATGQVSPAPPPIQGTQVKVANISCKELEDLGEAIRKVLQDELERGKTRKVANIRAQSLALEAKGIGSIYKGWGGWISRPLGKVGLVGAPPPQDILELSIEDELTLHALSTTASGLAKVFGPVGEFAAVVSTQAAKRLGVLIGRQAIRGIGYAEVRRNKLGTMNIIYDKEERAVWVIVDLDDLKDDWKGKYGWQGEHLHLHFPVNAQAQYAEGQTAVVLAGEKAPDLTPGEEKARSAGTAEAGKMPAAPEQAPSPTTVPPRPAPTLPDTKTIPAPEEAGGPSPSRATGTERTENVDTGQPSTKSPPKPTDAGGIELKWILERIGAPEPFYWGLNPPKNPSIGDDGILYVEVAAPDGPRLYAVDIRSGTVRKTAPLKVGYRLLGASGRAIYIANFDSHHKEMQHLLALDKATWTQLWEMHPERQLMRVEHITSFGLFVCEARKISPPRMVLDETTGSPLCRLEGDDRKLPQGMHLSRESRVDTLGTCYIAAVDEIDGSTKPGNVVFSLRMYSLRDGRLLWANKLPAPYDLLTQGDCAVTSNDKMFLLGMPLREALRSEMFHDPFNAAYRGPGDLLRVVCINRTRGGVEWKSRPLEDIDSAPRVAGVSRRALVLWDEVSHGYEKYALWLGIDASTGSLLWKKLCAPGATDAAAFFCPEFAGVVDRALVLHKDDRLFLVDVLTGTLIGSEPASVAGSSSVILFDETIVVRTGAGLRGYQVRWKGERTPSLPPPEPATNKGGPPQTRSEKGEQEPPPGGVPEEAPLGRGHATPAEKPSEASSRLSPAEVPSPPEELVGGPGVVRPVRDDDPTGKVKWTISQRFGAYYPDMGGFHPGEDWNLPGAADLGKPVYAVADGQVVKVSELRGNRGHLIALEHTAPPGRPFLMPANRGSDGRQEFTSTAERLETVYSVYVHVVPTSGIESRKTVKRGEVIATVADITPLSPHLHFEIRHPKAVPSQDWPMVLDASRIAEEPQSKGRNFVPPEVTVNVPYVGPVRIPIGKQEEKKPGPSDALPLGTSNWARTTGGMVTGYYVNLQKMIDAGLRDPSAFIDANRP